MNPLRLDVLALSTLLLTAACTSGNVAFDDSPSTDDTFFSDETGGGTDETGHTGETGDVPAQPTTGLLDGREDFYWDRTELDGVVVDSARSVRDRNGHRVTLEKQLGFYGPEGCTFRHDYRDVETEERVTENMIDVTPYVGETKLRLVPKTPSELFEERTCDLTRTDSLFEPMTIHCPLPDGSVEIYIEAERTDTGG